MPDIRGTAEHLRIAAESAKDPLPTTLLPGARLLDTRYPPLAFVCVPYVPLAEVIEIVGPHGSFKSTIALDLALSVASGRTWCGVPVTQGTSAFVTMEDREAVIAYRVAAYLAGIDDRAERGMAESQIRERFSFLAREQAAPLALTFTDRGGTVRRDDSVQRVTVLVGGRSLVILETASRLHPGPETNEGHAIFASAVEHISTASGAACGVVRHVAKATAREVEKEPDSYWGRGGGAFSDAARSVLAVRVDTGKDGEPRDPLAPVRLYHVKPPPFSRRGDSLAWKPTLVDPDLLDGPIYLRPLSQAEQLWEAANRLHQHLMNSGADGLTKSELHKHPPCGLTREVAKAAAEKLVRDRRVRVVTEIRGRTKQKAVVFRAIGASE